MDVTEIINEISNIHVKTHKTGSVINDSTLFYCLWMGCITSTQQTQWHIIHCISVTKYSISHFPQSVSITFNEYVCSAICESIPWANVNFLYHMAIFIHVASENVYAMPKSIYHMGNLTCHTLNLTNKTHVHL